MKVRKLLLLTGTVMYLHVPQNDVQSQEHTEQEHKEYKINTHITKYICLQSLWFTIVTVQHR